MLQDNKTPAVTSQNLPTPPAPAGAPPPAGAKFLGDETIVAKPLSSADFTNLRVKNPNISLRWVNRLAMDGIWYEQMKSMGFVNATVNDVEAPTFLLKDSAIIKGDLILMKIAKKDYLGALKYNVERATDRLTRRLKEEKGKQSLREALAEVGAPPELTKKISAFLPGEKEVEAVVGGESK